MIRTALVSLLVLGSIVGGVVLIKGKQFSAEAVMQLPPSVVTSAVAQTMSWDRTRGAVGTARANQGVLVTAESSGVVQKIHFQSGQEVKAGDLLVELDASVMKAQREAIQAQYELAEISARRIRTLVGQRATAQSDLDTAEAQLKEAKAQLEAIDAQIADMSVFAPFTGRLGIRQINLGQFVDRGDAIVNLEAVDPMHVDFTLPQQQLGNITVGDNLRLTLSGGQGETVAGKITAIDPRVDATTRSLRIEGTFSNPDGRFRTGMYLDVQVVAPEPREVTVVPITAVYFQPFGNVLFTIAPGAEGSPRAVEQRFVRTGEKRGDFVEVIEGVQPGEEVVSIGVFKLSAGSQVIVDNSQALPVSLNPEPENR